MADDNAAVLDAPTNKRGSPWRTDVSSIGNSQRLIVAKMQETPPLAVRRAVVHLDPHEGTHTIILRINEALATVEQRVEDARRDEQNARRVESITADDLRAALQRAAAARERHRT